MKKIVKIVVPCLLGNFLYANYAEQACKQPIAFSIVREDSVQDLAIIKRYFPEQTVSMAMVASGGCTAALLAAQAPLKDLTLVDPNPAQLALSKLKIQLLFLPPKKRLEILGYLPLPASERATITQGYLQALDINPIVFGDMAQIAHNGFDNEGRYEKVFEALRNELAPYKKELEALFATSTIDDQIKILAPQSHLGSALDKALDKIMSQDNLVKLFGEKATANRVQDFSRHFAQRIRWYVSHHLASSSPWLANLLLGHFHGDVMFPWLSASQIRPLPPIAYYQGLMNNFLEGAKTEQYDVIHVSNILDWLTPKEAEKTLQLAYRALKPGGVIIIRQLNSNIDIPKIGSMFTWDLKASQEFSDTDRSFFYRNFFLGSKPKAPLAPRVKELADATLQEIPVIEGSFFRDLSTMDKETFKSAQAQFFFAVDYFSRPMAALVARLPLHESRIDIIHNIVEEHGDFNKEAYHSNTFKKFLSTLGVTNEYMQKLLPAAPVTMFNSTLMGTCSHEDPIVAIACDGIIEYAFADISALLAEMVVSRGWVKKDDLVHYNLHADIDKIHAEEFFKIIEPCMDDPEQRKKVVLGLRLGAYIFDRLYEDLYLEAQLTTGRLISSL